MYKVFVVVALLAATKAAPADHQATSFASFNDKHSSVHHSQSDSPSVNYGAPTPSHYAAPTIGKLATPTFAKFVIPQVTSYFNEPTHHISAPAGHVYSAPAVAKIALPVAKIAPITYAAPVTKYVAAPSYSAHQEEYAPAKYEFAYSIEDAHTGDFHSQQEQRDGDHVVGQYSLHEADGTVRIVKYTDEGHGFNAVVERQGHPTEAPTYKKVVAVTAPQYAHNY